MEKIKISSESLKNFKEQVAASEKYFCVYVDFTMSKSIRVKAENEEQAMLEAQQKVNQDLYEYARNFSHCVGFEIIDAEEE